MEARAPGHSFATDDMADLVKTEFCPQAQRGRGTVNRYVFVIGVSGSGKSALIQHMLANEFKDMDLERFKVGDGSVTGVITKYKLESFTWGSVRDGNGPRYQYTFWDTVGLGAPDKPLEGILFDTERILQQQPEIHKIFVCIKLERKRLNVSDDLRKMIELMKKYNPSTENWSLCITYVDPWEPKLIQGDIEKLVENYGLSELIPKENHMLLCFSKLTDLRSDAIELYKKWINESILRVHQELQTNITPFAPLELTFERQQQEQQRLQQLQQQQQFQQQQQQLQQQQLQQQHQQQLMQIQQLQQQQKQQEELTDQQRQNQQQLLQQLGLASILTAGAALVAGMKLR